MLTKSSLSLSVYYLIYLSIFSSSFFAFLKGEYLAKLIPISVDNPVICVGFKKPLVESAQVEFCAPQQNERRNIIKVLIVLWDKCKLFWESSSDKIRIKNKKRHFTDVTRIYRGSLPAQNLYPEKR